MNIIHRGFRILAKPSHYHVNNIRNVAFKSAISLDTLYPQNNLKITTPEKPPSAGKQFSGFIPVDELEITYSRSSGPGGQNVNVVSTKVDLRFNIQKASWLDDEIKSKLAEKFKTKITKDGYMVFRSDLTRSQQLNLADCLEKVRSSIRRACFTPAEQTEETLEKIRKRQEEANRKRFTVKRQRSLLKSDRKDPTL